MPLLPCNPAPSDSKSSAKISISIGRSGPSNSCVKQAYSRCCYSAPPVTCWCHAKSSNPVDEDERVVVLDPALQEPTFRWFVKEASVSFANIPNKAEDYVTPCFVICKQVHFLSSSRTPLFVSATDAVVHLRPMRRIMDNAFLVSMGLLDQDRQGGNCHLWSKPFMCLFQSKFFHQPLSALFCKML